MANTPTKAGSVALSPEQGLSRYLSEIRKFPMLEKNEEFMLARQWRDQEDTEAAERMVTSHLRLVAKIAMGYRGYGLPMAEVISEGNVGLMQAVKKFDPEKGFRLATYAMWWIRAAIQEYILRSWSLVKLGTTAAQKKLFFNLRRLKGEMKALDEGDLRPEQAQLIAEKLNVTEAEVYSMNGRMSGSDASLNVPMGTDGGACPAQMPRSTCRWAPTATWNGRTGWQTMSPERPRRSPTARNSTAAWSCLRARWRTSPSASVTS
jgi:RNA polymerase sigma-32 factor